MLLGFRSCPGLGGQLYVAWILQLLESVKPVVYCLDSAVVGVLEASCMLLGFCSCWGLGGQLYVAWILQLLGV